MGAIAENIRQAVREDRFVFSVHADQMLRERRITGWQIVEGVEAATLLRERPDAVPNPIAEFEQLLADGTPVKAVWGWIKTEKVAKRITVHFFDR